MGEEGVRGEEEGASFITRRDPSWLSTHDRLPGREQEAMVIPGSVRLSSLVLI